MDKKIYTTTDTQQFSKELEKVLNHIMKLSDELIEVSWTIIKIKKEYENEIKRNN